MSKRLGPDSSLNKSNIMGFMAWYMRSFKVGHIASLIGIFLRRLYSANSIMILVSFYDRDFLIGLEKTVLWTFGVSFDSSRERA